MHVCLACMPAYVVMFSEWLSGVFSYYCIYVRGYMCARPHKTTHTYAQARIHKQHTSSCAVLKHNTLECAASDNLLLQAKDVEQHLHTRWNRDVVFNLGFVRVVFIQAKLVVELDATSRKY